MARGKYHWIYKCLFILVWMAVIIYGATGGAAVIRYNNDIKGNCTVVMYEKDINKIRVKVRFTPGFGRGKWKCHYSDQELYDKCAGALMDDHPVGSTDVCWYNKNNYDGKTYLMYWERRRVKYFWEIFGALITALVVLITMYFIPDNKKNSYSPV